MLLSAIFPLRLRDGRCRSPRCPPCSRLFHFARGAVAEWESVQAEGIEFRQGGEK